MLRKFLPLTLFLSVAFNAWAGTQAIYITPDDDPIDQCYLNRKFADIHEHYSNGQREFKFYLTSGGGDVGAVMNFLEQLDNLPGLQIETVVQAHCSSACVPLFAYGQTRSMARSSHLYVHGLNVASRQALHDTREVTYNGCSSSGRYRCALGTSDRDCLSRPAIEYLARIHNASPAFADAVTETVRGPTHRGRFWNRSEIRDTAADFLNRR